jgi:hypothetical protein
MIGIETRDHSAEDDTPRRRVNFRVWQLAVVAATLLVTAWSYKLHVAIGIAMTFLAKHVLVAVLAAGLHLRDCPQSGTSP